jgi:cytoskeletal protein CcmA (bactofilin family)
VLVLHGFRTLGSGIGKGSPGSGETGRSRIKIAGSACHDNPIAGRRITISGSAAIIGEISAGRADNEVSSHYCCVGAQNKNEFMSATDTIE